MPYWPHSSAATRVSMSTPAFDAEYADSHRPLRAAATELMLTMLPPPALRIAFASVCVERYVPLSVESVVIANRSGGVARKLPTIAPYAEFTARCRGPFRSTAVATALPTDSVSVMSQVTQPALLPRESEAVRNTSSRRP